MVRSAIALLVVLPLAAQPRAAADWPAERARRLEAAVEAERVRQGVVGLTAAISTTGILRWQDAFGKADLENDVAARPGTLFRTASIAKPMTAVAALGLAGATIARSANTGVAVALAGWGMVVAVSAYGTRNLATAVESGALIPLYLAATVISTVVALYETSGTRWDRAWRW